MTARLSDETLKDYAEYGRLLGDDIDLRRNAVQMARECLALRAEVDRLKLKVVELSRGAWVEDTAERDALRAEVARLGVVEKGLLEMERNRDHWWREAQALKARLAALTERVDSLENEYAAACMAGDALEADRDALKAELDRLADVEPQIQEWQERALAAEARLAALTDPATVERVARAIRDAFCRGIPDHGRTPCVVEVGDREAARAALAALGDVKPPATRNLP